MTANETNPDELFGCDLIMKGGIASGVLYPPAIAELSKTHRFHSIGGSSAGALGAVAAAAAEYARQKGDRDAFDALGGTNDVPGLNDLLAVQDETGRTLLQRLFVPQESTKQHFDLLWTLKTSKRKAGPLLRAVASHSNLFPQSQLGLAGLALLLTAIILGVAGSSSLLLGIAIGIVGVVGVGLWSGTVLADGAKKLLTDLQDTFVENHFGLANGNKVGEQEGVTSWVHQQVQRLAKGGTDRSSKPLTYGDLDSVGIELVTMTTNASQGSSEPFPFVDEDAWAFDPNDMEELLPPDVVEHMVRIGREVAENWSSKELRPPDWLLPLPPAEQLPVLLGARLSFPIPPVLSAFPLYRRVSPPSLGVDDSVEAQWDKIVLTDGGLCSNLPVHLFDAALPSRPTFAINLSSGPLPEEVPNDDEMMRAHRLVSRPMTADATMDIPVHHIGSMKEFLLSVLEVPRNWSDNSTQSEVGVRDRICTVQLAPHEGGSNLDMSPETIAGLSYRGRAAAENLAWMTTGVAPPSDPTRGSDVPNTQWLRHRWTRLLTTIDGTAVFADKLAKRYLSEQIVRQGGTEPKAATYSDLAKNAVTLREVLDLDPAFWDEGNTQDLENIVTSLAEVPFAEADLDVSASQRKLVLSTRKPTRTVPKQEPMQNPLP